MKISITATQLAALFNNPERFQDAVLAHEQRSITNSLRNAFAAGLQKAADATRPAVPEVK